MKATVALSIVALVGFIGRASGTAWAAPPPSPSQSGGGKIQRNERSHAAGQTVTLRAVGDILLGGPMGELMARKGRGYPFAFMKPTLRSADIAFGNLECCISDRGSPIPKQYNFRASPRRTSVLAEVGFKMVSVANNHAWDFGREALSDTVNNVRRVGVQTVGAGTNRWEAHALQILTVRGVRVGFLAYLGLWPPLLPEAKNAPSLSMATVPVIRHEVRAARPLVDVLIVSLHDGKENSPTPNAHQKELARAAIDAGADLVIGHHPHVVELMERYHRKVICYSLGNFVFSTTGRGSGAMLEATLDRTGCQAARLVPLYLVGPQPRLIPPPRPQHKLRRKTLTKSHLHGILSLSMRGGAVR